MRNLAGNIRYSIRQFPWSPVFTAAAIITLAGMSSPKLKQFAIDYVQNHKR